MAHTKSFDEGFFSRVECEEQAYWLGFIMADGCVRLRPQPRVDINLSSRDAHHLEKWHRALDSDNEISWTSAGTVYSSHYSGRLADDLIKLGCVPRKSLLLRFPTIPSEIVRHLIRGYFDGDGCITLFRRPDRPKPEARICIVGTEQFLLVMQQAVGVSTKLMPTGNNKVARAFQFGGANQVLAFGEYLYQDATVFLERKRERFQELAASRV